MLAEISEIWLSFLASSLKLILSNIPYNLWKQWRAIVCESQENAQQRARFDNIVEFIEKQAKILLDPVSGSIQDLSTKITNAALQKKYLRKRRFTTMISPVVIDSQQSKENISENTQALHVSKHASSA